MKGVGYAETWAASSPLGAFACGFHAINGSLLDRGIRRFGRGWSRSVSGECAGDEESAGAQKRRAGESVADEAAHLWAVAQFVPAVAANSHDANVLAAAQ